MDGHREVLDAPSETDKTVPGWSSSCDLCEPACWRGSSAHLRSALGLKAGVKAAQEGVGLAALPVPLHVQRVHPGEKEQHPIRRSHFGRSSRNPMPPPSTSSSNGSWPPATTSSMMRRPCSARRGRTYRPLRIPRGPLAHGPVDQPRGACLRRDRTAHRRGRCRISPNDRGYRCVPLETSRSFSGLSPAPLAITTKSCVGYDRHDVV